MTPSSAVTRTAMTFAPTSSATASLAVPLVAAASVLPRLPTCTVALPVAATVGVSFTCVIAFETVAV